MLRRQLVLLHLSHNSSWIYDDLLLNQLLTTHYKEQVPCDNIKHGVTHMRCDYISNFGVFFTRLIYLVEGTAVATCDSKHSFVYINVYLYLLMNFVVSTLLSQL